MEVNMNIKNLDKFISQITDKLLENKYIDPEFKFDKNTIFNFDNAYGLTIDGSPTNLRYDCVFRIKGKRTVRKAMQMFAEGYVLWCWDNGLDPRIEYIICEIVEYEEVSHVSFEDLKHTYR